MKRLTTRQQIQKLKEELARSIRNELEFTGMTQTLAAKRITEATGRHEAPSQLSLVCSGKLAGFSVERLMLMNAGLGKIVNTHVHPGKHGQGRITADYHLT